MTAGAHTVAAKERSIPFARRAFPWAVMLALVTTLVVAGLIAATIGPAKIPLGRIAAALYADGADPVLLHRDQIILLTIRLPRIAMASIVGALLAGAGAAMQGLFRNPLADPGLVGVSAGASLAAAAAIVLADKAAPSLMASAAFLLPLAAFCGALATTALLYRMATRQGRTSIATMLLAGLALGALAGAGTGLLVFLADDRQLRDITFWMLGSLAGATWQKVAAITPVLVSLLLLFPAVGRGLDSLALGETEAFHVGVAVERLKRLLIVLVAAAAGAAVSVSGVIGFVGIIVPHLLRLAIGSGHRLLLPASAFGGAILLVMADTFARTIAAPAELPIGIVTALIGAPFFLFLLLSQHSLLVG
jgi:iron complex transport system permease protein